MNFYRKALIRVTCLTLFAVIGVSNTYAIDTNSDEFKAWFYEKSRPSIENLVRDKNLVASPFPERFMDSGYFMTTSSGYVMFVNTVFGVMIVAEAADNKISYIGAATLSELYSSIGEDTSEFKTDFIKARFNTFPVIATKITMVLNGNPEVLKNDFTNRKRDYEINEILIGGPIARSEDQVTQKCLESFDATTYNHKMEREKGQKLSDTKGFFPVDLIPYDEKRGALILLDAATKRMRVFVAVERTGNICKFGEILDYGGW